MKKVVVTGSEGFIGKNLCKYLQEENQYEVIEVDIKHPTNPISILDKDALGKACVDAYAIVHLAAISNANDCTKNPVLAFNTNITGTHNVLDAAYDNGAKVIFASSASVYGKKPALLGSPLDPHDVYSCTKLEGERIIELYASAHRINYSILRLFNVYGNGGKGAVNKFIENIEAGMPIYIHNKYVTRDFIWVEDVVAQIGIEIDYLESRQNILNVGTGMSTSIVDLPKLLALYYGDSIINNIQYLTPSKEEYILGSRAGDIPIYDAEPIYFTLDQGLRLFLNDRLGTSSRPSS